jgi:hypothetical protein
MSEALHNQYCAFLKLMGHRVVQTPSSLWVNIRPGIFQPAPPSCLNNIPLAEVRDVLKSTNAVACRWFSPKCGSKSSRNILYTAKPPYDLSCLHQKARNQTRRGLERVAVRLMEPSEETLRLAYPVYIDNVKRLNLFKNEKQIADKWGTWCNTLRIARCVDLWCAWHDQTIVAFTVAVRTPWGMELVLQRSARNALDLYPNNALVYTAIRHAFEQGSPLVSFGLGAFGGEKDSLHHFKKNMGFNDQQLDEHYAWHTLVRPLTPLLNSRRLRSVYKFLAN